MGVTAYSEWYKHGTARVLEPGTYYHVNMKSLDIPEGYEVDLQGADWSHDITLAAGGNAWGESYHGLLFSPHLHDNDIYKLTVRKVDYKVASCALVGWRHQWSNGHYDVWWSVPPTTSDGVSKYFPNDLIEKVRVPANCVVKVRQNGDGSGWSLEYSEPGEHVFDGSHQHQASNVAVIRDGFKQTGITFDWEHRHDHESGDVQGATVVAVNHSKIQQSIGVALSTEEGTSADWSWETSVTAGASVEVSGGVKPFGIGADATITASVEATVGASGSKGKSTTTSVSHTAEADVPARSKMQVTAMVKKLDATCPTVETLVNKRTGETVQQRGHVRIRSLSFSDIVFGEAVSLD